MKGTVECIQMYCRVYTDVRHIVVLNGEQLMGVVFEQSVDIEM